MTRCKLGLHSVVRSSPRDSTGYLGERLGANQTWSPSVAQTRRKQLAVESWQAWNTTYVHDSSHTKQILQLLGERKQTPSLPGTMGEEKKQILSVSRKRQKVLLPDSRYFCEKGRSKSCLSLGSGQEGISDSQPVPKQSTDLPLIEEIQQNGLLLNTHHKYKA